jgi:dihydropteroate synthase
MHLHPTYDDVAREVGDYLHARRVALVAAGVDRARICLDPGLGFGKSAEQSLTLMRHCRQLHELGCPLLVGASRKSFLGRLIGDRDADRTSATIGAALALAAQGVQILRVHDVRRVREALVAFEAAGGLDTREDL